MSSISSPPVKSTTSLSRTSALQKPFKRPTYTLFDIVDEIKAKQQPLRSLFYSSVHKTFNTENINFVKTIIEEYENNKCRY